MFAVSVWMFGVWVLELQSEKSEPENQTLQGDGRNLEQPVDLQKREHLVIDYSKMTFEGFLSASSSKGLEVRKG